MWIQILCARSRPESREKSARGDPLSLSNQLALPLAAGADFVLGGNVVLWCLAHLEARPKPLGRYTAWPADSGDYQSNLLLYHAANVSIESHQPHRKPHAWRSRRYFT